MMNANRFHLTRPGVNPAPDCAVWDMALLRDIPWCGGGVIAFGTVDGGLPHGTYTGL
jgi:hypothetical protein